MLPPVQNEVDGTYDGDFGSLSDSTYPVQFPHDIANEYAQDVSIMPPKYAYIDPGTEAIPKGNAVHSRGQLAALMFTFEKNNLPSRKEVRRLSRQIGIQYDECLSWFKAKRAQVKRDGRQLDPSMTDGRKKRSSPCEKAAEESHVPNFTELNRAQKTRARDWAVQFSLVDDRVEREFMIHHLVQQLDFKQRKDLKKMLLNQPLNLTQKNDFKPRKSCADPTLSRESITTRAQKAWKYMQARFGADPEEKMHSIDREGHILLDAAMVQGLQAVFARHRDYLIALARRFNFIGQLDTSPSDDEDEIVPFKRIKSTTV